MYNSHFSDPHGADGDYDEVRGSGIKISSRWFARAMYWAAEERLEGTLHKMMHIDFGQAIGADVVPERDDAAVREAVQFLVEGGWAKSVNSGGYVHIILTKVREKDDWGMEPPWEYSPNPKSTRFWRREIVCMPGIEWLGDSLPVPLLDALEGIKSMTILDTL